MARIPHSTLANIAVTLGCHYIERHDSRYARALSRKFKRVSLVLKQGRNYTVRRGYFSRKKQEWRLCSIGGKRGEPLAAAQQLVGVALYSA